MSLGSLELRALGGGWNPRLGPRGQRGAPEGIEGLLINSSHFSNCETLYCLFKSIFKFEERLHDHCKTKSKTIHTVKCTKEKQKLVSSPQGAMSQ